MKKKRPQFLKAFGFCLFLALGSCERDEALEKTAQKNPISFDLSKKTWKELESDLSFNTSLFRLSQRKSGASSANAMRTAMEATHGFTISGDDVTVAQMEQITSYTMLITRPETDTTFFENLVIDIPDEGEPRALLVKYTPSEAMVEGLHGTPTFKGTKEITFLDFESGQSFQALGSDDPCQRIVIKWCDNDLSGGTGEKHLAGDRCVNENHIWYETIWFGCGGGGGGDSGPGGDGPGPGPGTGPGTGPGGPGGGPGNGGGPPIGTTPTVPSGPGQQQGIVPQEKQCQELKKIALNTNIKNSLKNLEEKTDEDRENAYVYRFLNDNYVPQPVPRPARGTGQIGIPHGNKIIGAAHTHTCEDDSYQMFSAEDIFVFAKIASTYQHGDGPRDYSKFFFIMVSCRGTYALKIEDYTSFLGVISSKYDNKFRKELNSQYQRHQAQDMAGLQYEFLTFVKKYNLKINLYKADIYMTTWEKLSLEGDDVIPTKCN